MRSLAALMLCAACSGNSGDSSATPTDESDTDTDTDSDTDTDTDTDADLWDASVIFVYAGFGYDAETGEIVNATLGGTPLENGVFTTVLDLDRYMADPDSTAWCFVNYELPVGPVVSNPDYDSSSWLSFDLSASEITSSGDDGTSVHGDCDHLGSFMGTPRGDADLATFAATWGVGFGIGPLSSIDSATLSKWAEKVWPDHYADAWGDWKNVLPTLGSGSITVLDSAPVDSDVIIAYAMGDDGTITYDAHTGTGVANVLSHRDAAPTGYYYALSMYGLQL
jgi:hypothetical protein